MSRISSKSLAGSKPESDHVRRFYRCLGCAREVPAVQDVRTQLSRLRCTACGHRGFSYYESPIRGTTVAPSP